MTEFLRKIFGWKVGRVSIELFSIWHFLYIIFIAGAIVGGAFLLKNKSKQNKRKNLTSNCYNNLSFIYNGLYVAAFCNK